MTHNILNYIYKKNDLVKKDDILRHFSNLETVEINQILYKLVNLGFILEASEKSHNRIKYYYKITEDGKLYIEYQEKNNNSRI